MIWEPLLVNEKTTQYSYSYAHPEIVDPVPEATRASEGGGGVVGTLELMFQDPSPPPPLPPSPPRVYKQQEEFINTRAFINIHHIHITTSSPQHIKSHHMKRCIGQILYMHIEGINEYTYHITHQEFNRKCDCGRARTLEPYTAKQCYAIIING